ncbi:glucosidase family protein [Acidicapsa ligni]|uniref:hypothetical protein n=1 Tax=Acidicapsa ligni TaxID=542300 RepID=UPI0021E01E6D|nr:hypothetical protein [Acidicapsa ligni]
MTNSDISRRTFLQVLVAATTASYGHKTLGLLSPPSRHSEGLLHFTRSENFGIRADGTALNSGSRYRESTEHTSDLSFDISNNQISSSFTHNGDLRRACVCTGVDSLPLSEVKGGVYCAKRLLYGGPWGTQISVEGISKAAEHVEVALIENLFPLFSHEQGQLRCHRLVFAPVDVRNEARSPRAVIQIVLLENRSPDPYTVQVSLTALQENSFGTPAAQQPHDPGTNAKPLKQLSMARSRFLAMDQQSIQGADDIWSVSVDPHSSSTVAIAWVLAESEQEEHETIETLREKNVDSWLEDTLNFRGQAYGKLTIPEYGFAGEAMVRFAELSRQSALRSQNGTFCGGFLGSDVDVTPVNWARDGYYSALAMSMFQPGLCRDSILYFLKWGHAPETTGPGRGRFPNAQAVSQSLSNSVSGLSMAGVYYRATGDREFFSSRPEILDQARHIFDQVLSSRRGAPMLFPSLYFSDGEARGDYHTGSNVAAWFAFSCMSTIAAKAYRDQRLAHEWSSIAREIRAAIETHCVGDSPYGKRFYEGANADGSLVEGHDGEESETTLMPFYGFCEPDDIRLQNHAHLAMTAANPLYSSELDAIWWYNSDWRSATFPGFTTAMAGASDEAQLQDRLDRIRSLTDFDGSLWWWPYPYGSKDRNAPMRGDGARKCGWAAAVYLCRFVHDILGISIDAASRTVRFAPFAPWNQFNWNRARIGTTQFDFAYRNNGRVLSSTIQNHNRDAYTASIILTPGKGHSPNHLFIDGRPSPQERKIIDRWGRQCAQVDFLLKPGKRVEVSMQVDRSE